MKLRRAGLAALSSSILRRGPLGRSVGHHHRKIASRHRAVKRAGRGNQLKQVQVCARNARTHMSYHVQTRWGGSETDPTEKRMLEILDELEVEDAEHPDCWLTHETGGTLSVFEGGRVAYENCESDCGPRHIANIPRLKALEMWKTLAKGDLATLEKEQWQPGYHPPLSDAELSARKEEVERVTRDMDRRFYDSLGEERQDFPCKHKGCPRGAVQFSVFCRPHHFESLIKRPCPFSL